MKKMNFPLAIGSIIVALLIIVSFFPGLFTSKDPLFEEEPRYIEYEKDGELVEVFGTNPMPPTKENIMGTDDAGRDVYSRLVYGTRNTMRLAVLIAIMRILIALPMGMAAGMGIRSISAFINLANTYFTAIPMLIFSYVILNIGYFRTLYMEKAIWAFAIVLTFVGWAKLAGIIEDTTKRVMKEDFIEGEVAIGKTKLQIAYQNVLPHIIPSSISLFFKEMGMALFLIAQLAVLYVFVGYTRPPKALSFKANYDMILEPEWGGTLSRIAIDVKKAHKVYWMTFYPILTFVIAIIGINLTGEGLRIEFQKRDSRFVSNIRKIYYLVSPKTFFSQIKDFKKYKKAVISKSLIIIGIIVYVVVPWHPSAYDFNLLKAKEHLKELTDLKYEGRVTGTKGGYEAGEYIVDELKSYGYTMETIDVSLVEDVEMEGKKSEVPKITAPVTVENGQMKLTYENGEEKIYYLNKDFAILTVNRNIFLDKSNNKVSYKGRIFNEENISNATEEDKIFLIRKESSFLYGFGSENVSYNYGMDRRDLEYEVQFFVQEDIHSIDNTYSYYSTTIIPSEELKKELESEYIEAEISFDCPKVAEYSGRNIIAFLPGEGKSLEDKGELLVIGTSYDGGKLIGGKEVSAMSATSVATTLEVARVLAQTDEKLEKSIQFIFFDNEHYKSKYSELDGSYHYGMVQNRPVEMALDHGYYYLDITYPGFDVNNREDFNVVTFPPQRGDKSSYLMGLGIEKRLKQMDIKYRRFHSDYRTSMAMRNMRLNALASVAFGTTEVFGLNTDVDHIDNINYERMEDIGQMIVDTITMNPYIME